MIISVMYSDNRYDMVKTTMLEELIRSKTVARFKRSSGWVTVGVDPIRSPRKTDRYDGPERRSPETA